MNTEQPFSVSASFALLLRLVDAGPCFAQQERGKALPRVWVLATGGTIAGTGASSTDLSN
jgi:L-asparaginase/Glu-tRNA(Gln) amidotransferase subunit D